MISLSITAMEMFDKATAIFVPIHRFSPLPEVAWKRGLRAKVENMVESSKHLSHKCCAAALCSNSSDNRKDIIFHAFPKDQILRKTWEIKMKDETKNSLPAEPSIVVRSTLSRRTTERV